MNAFVVKRETVKSTLPVVALPIVSEKVSAKRKIEQTVTVPEKKHKEVEKRVDGDEKAFEIPPAIMKHIDTLTQWFHSAMIDKREGREIEGKIGSYSSEGFQSVVPASIFNMQLARCQRAASAGGIFEKSERQTTVTYLFANGVRGTQYSDQKSEFVRKRRVSNFDISFGNNNQNNNALTARLSFNIETPCQPPCEKIQLVRLRQRESFYYKGTWRFDFTYVRQGATKPEATNAPLQHEIELEYIASGNGVEMGELSEGATEEQRARYNVTSMLLKLNDLTIPEGGANSNDPCALTILQHVVKQD